MPRLHAHPFALALLLAGSTQALASPSDAGLQYPDDRFPFSSEGLLQVRKAVPPGMTLLKTSFGTYGRGVLGVDWRGATDGYGGTTDLLQTREGRLPASLRLAVYTDGAVGWHRLDNSCRGNSADRCSMVSVSLGIHGASASMQWREDGARALIARRESAQDDLHLRLQVNYRF